MGYLAASPKEPETAFSMPLLFFASQQSGASVSHTGFAETLQHYLLGRSEQLMTSSGEARALSRLLGSDTMMTANRRGTSASR